MISSAFHQIGTSHRTDTEQPLPSPPFISIPGVVNFRCLPTNPSSPTSTSASNFNSSNAQSPTFRPDTIFRSGQLNTITHTGARALAVLGVRKCFDLRSSRERQKQLDEEATSLQGLGTQALEAAGVDVIWVPVFSDEEVNPAVLERRWADYTAPEEDGKEGRDWRYSPGFVRAYREILKEGRGAFRRILEEIRDGDGKGVLVHCTAGKDRTGVFVALVLRLVGVEADMVEEDYALSGIGLRGWREETIRVLTGERERVGTQEREGMEKEEKGSERAGYKKMTREQAERALAAERGTMKILLRDVLEGEEGGVENYLQKRCGFSIDDIDKIKKRLLVV